MTNEQLTTIQNGDQSMIVPFKERHWWKSAVVYQIYPHSFCDSNGDGIGDLPGITSKVDYLKGLGVDCIWLSPIYKSPFADCGYDISDYQMINPDYGTMEDWEKLLEKVHSCGMKLIMDLVVNHSSDEHAWFKESASSTTNAKRDWYIWRKGSTSSDGTPLPPNNWRSVFGSGSAWTYSPTTAEWYLRLFTEQQPDLNWENPELREAVFEMMRWWLDKGVDGFRMDVINLISKVDGLPDATPSADDAGQPFVPSFEHTANGPRVHEFLREMNAKVLSKYDILTVGETPFTHDPEVLNQYLTRDQLQMVFQFEMHDIDGTPANPMVPKPFPLSAWKAVIDKWQLKCSWNSIYFENHDQARSITRFASDKPEDRAKGAKLLSLFQNTLSGTIYIFQGQEIGMINMPKDWGFAEYKDVATLDWIEGQKDIRAKETSSKDSDLSDLLPYMREKARDNARTPMQWNTTAHAGFTSGNKPWMRVHDDFAQWNVAVQSKDPKSVNSFYKEIFRMRKENPVLVYGDFKLIDPANEQIISYTRTDGDDKVLVVLNFTDKPQAFELPEDLDTTKAQLLMGTMNKGTLKAGKVELEAWEGVAFTL